MFGGLNNPSFSLSNNTVFILYDRYPDMKCTSKNRLNIGSKGLDAREVFLLVWQNEGRSPLLANNLMIVFISGTMDS